MCTIYKGNKKASRLESLKKVCNLSKNFETGCLLLDNLTSTSKFLTQLTFLTEDI